MPREEISDFFPIKKNSLPTPLSTHCELIPDSYINAELSILFCHTRFTSRGLGKYILSLLLCSYFVLHSVELFSLVNPLIADIVAIVEHKSIETDWTIDSVLNQV